jgi:hypothetical protein
MDAMQKVTVPDMPVRLLLAWTVASKGPLSLPAATELHCPTVAVAQELARRVAAFGIRLPKTVVSQIDIEPDADGEVAIPGGYVWEAFVEDVNGRGWRIDTGRAIGVRRRLVDYPLNAQAPALPKVVSLG